MPELLAVQALFKATGVAYCFCSSIAQSFLSGGSGERNGKPCGGH